jgi:hypothetical protein
VQQIEFGMMDLDQASTVSADCLLATVSKHKRHFRVLAEAVILGEAADFRNKSPLPGLAARH